MMLNPLNLLEQQLCDWALWYAEQGFYVFPVIGKKPGLKDWQDLATTDKGIICEWWSKKYRGCNIGIATGERSGLLVLDVDLKHIVDCKDGVGQLSKQGIDQLNRQVIDQLNKLRNECPELKTTPLVLSGRGGFHFYLAYPQGESIKNKAKMIDGFDLRSNGGLIVAPPSIHEKTHCSYQFVPNHPGDFIYGNQ